jgi:aryl sulfotransferase
MMMIRPALREYRTWSTDSRRWAGYQPRPDDIILATGSKSGTTWMQQIVSSLVFQDAATRALAVVSPWIDVRFRAPASEMHQALATQTHRRFPKTHLPVDGLPLFDDVQYIHVARDGRDAFMSMHNHFTGFSQTQITNFDRIGLEDPVIGKPFPTIPADAAEYFRLWISTPAVAGQTDGLPHQSYFDSVAGYWAERRRPNFLLVHYNDLRHDLDAEMRRVAAFLGIGIDEAVWPSLVHAAGFKEMQAAGDALMPQLKTVLADGPRRFFNKGTNGRWRDVLTDDDLALYDAKVREKFSSGLTAWLEGGRHATREPRDFDD